MGDVVQPEVAPPQGPVHPSVEENKGPRGAGLAVKWDNIPEIRHRMREGYNLLVHYDAKLKKATNSDVERNIQNVRANIHVLQPVCRMISTDGLLIIDDLEYDIKQIFSLYNVLASEKTISKQAWAIRYLIQVLKQQVKGDKDDPSRVKRCPKDRLFWKNMIIFFFNVGLVLTRGPASKPKGHETESLSSPGHKFAELACGPGCPGASGLFKGWVGSSCPLQSAYARFISIGFRVFPKLVIISCTCRFIKENYSEFVS